MFDHSAPLTAVKSSVPAEWDSSQLNVCFRAATGCAAAGSTSGRLCFPCALVLLRWFGDSNLSVWAILVLVMLFFGGTHSSLKLSTRVFRRSLKSRRLKKMIVELDAQRKVDLQFLGCEWKCNVLVLWE